MHQNRVKPHRIQKRKFQFYVNQMKGINYLLKEVGIGVIFEPRVGYRHRHKINYSL